MKAAGLIFGVCVLASSMLFAQTAPEARVFTEIRVEGNERFRDGDILVTADLQPGVLYSEEDLRLAVENLDFTGEFKSVRIYSEGPILFIDVDEQPAAEGQLTFGLGVDSDSGVFGAVGLRVSDAFGIGAELRGELTVAEEFVDLGFSIYDPDLFSETVGGGVRFAYTEYDYDNTLFEYDRWSITPFITVETGSRSDLELRLSLSETQISDVDPAASAILQSEAGTLQTQALGATYRFGGIDRTIDTASWGFALDAEVAGFGGDVKYTRAQARVAGFVPIGNGFAIRSALELARIKGRDGSQLRTTDRFFLGGSSLRGFERGEISPRDIDGATTTELGGNSLAVLRTDFLVPLFPEERGVDTFIFADVGAVWDIESSVAPSGVLQDSRTYRHSAGIGASIDTSFGRFEAYFAFAADGRAEDEEQKFGLTFRSQF